MPKPPPKPQPTTPRQLNGAVHRVPCPWCGKTNDVRNLEQQQLLDAGTEYDCDHCGHIVQVLAVQMVKLVTVRQHPQKVGVVKREQDPAQATTIHPSQINRRR